MALIVIPTPVTPTVEQASKQLANQLKDQATALYRQNLAAFNQMWTQKAGQLRLIFADLIADGQRNTGTR